MTHDNMLALSQSMALFRTAEVKLHNRNEIRSSEFKFLIYIANSGISLVTPVDVSRYFSCTKAFVSKTLRSLKSRAWVQIVENPKDGRSVGIEVTQKGMTRVTEAMDEYMQTTAAIVGSMGEDRAMLFHSLLDEATAILSALSLATGHVDTDTNEASI